MKILLKILVAPFALVLSLLTALLVFLFDICAVLLTIASVILAVLGVALFFTPTPIGGIVFLFLAFLLSPYGLQAECGSEDLLSHRHSHTRKFQSLAHDS